MRRSLLAVAAALTLSGCARDLAIPDKVSLAVDPTFTSVAPREAVDFVATGGGGGFQYAFAEGGRLSGPDATIDAATGHYQAGRLGSALDVVVVTDAAGNRLTATISVGARLSVAPLLAGTAPGGGLIFVASGGRGPYAYALSAAPSGGSIDPDSGAFVAGAIGDVVDEVIVSDATLDAAATATAQVRVTSAVRLYRGSAGAVAPLEQVTFTAFGGQPPYAFTYLPGAARSGGTVALLTGEYRAGPTGGTTDRIRVTDDLGQLDELDVQVGPALAIAPPSGALRPGAATGLVASGGKPPYTFAFRPLCNRSGGTLEPTTGDYVPGPNTGALDEVMAVDAVGATATRALGAVGPTVLDAGETVWRCLAADVTGDGRSDAILFDFPPSSATATVTSVAMPAGATTPVTRQGWIDAARAADKVIAVDFGGTGHDLLAFFGAAGFWTLLPDASGNLTYGPSLPPSTFWASAPTPRVYPLAAARVTGGTRFYTGATCTVPSTGILAFDWLDGASAPSASPTCVALPWVNPLAFLFATDMDGDGTTDLVWIEYGAASSLAASPVRVAHGVGDGTFSPTTAYPFQEPAANMLTGDYTAELSSGGLFLRVGSGIAFLRRGTGGGASSWAFSPYFPAGIVSFIAGMSVHDPATDRVAAWDVYGHFVGVELSGSTPSTVTVLPGSGVLPARAACATFPDLDGDGIADALTPVWPLRDTQLFFGDGDGTLGSRFRFAAGGRWAMLGADVSGDGMADLVGATSTPALRVLAGGRHQLAYGGETSAPSAITTVAGGRMGPGGTPGVAFIGENDVLYYAEVAGGAVGTPAPVQSLWHSSGFATVDALVAADLDGADPRDDVLIVAAQGSEATGFSYLVDEVLSGTPASYVLSPAILFAQKRCVFLPVGQPDVASLCTVDRNAVVLSRSTRSGTSLPAFTGIATYPGTGGTRASMAAAGRLAGGTAVFVSAPSAPAGVPIAATAVAVAPLAVDPFYAVTTTALVGPGEPVTSAALGDVDGDGTPDLLVRSGGDLWVHAGVGDGTFASVGTSVRATGEVRGALGATAAGDVLVSIGDQIVVLVNDGAGTLR